MGTKIYFKFPIIEGLDVKHYRIRTVPFSLSALDQGRLLVGGSYKLYVLNLNKGNSFKVRTRPNGRVFDIHISDAIYLGALFGRVYKITRNLEFEAKSEEFKSKFYNSRFFYLYDLDEFDGSLVGATCAGIFEISKDPKIRNKGGKQESILSVTLRVPTMGCVYSLGTVDDRLYAGMKTNIVRIFRGDFTNSTSLRVSIDSIISLDVTPDYLALGSREGKVIVVDPDDGKLLGERYVGAPINKLKVNGDSVIAIAGNGKVYNFNIDRTLSVISSLSLSNSMLLSLALVGDDLYVGSIDRTVYQVPIKLLHSQGLPEYELAYMEVENEEIKLSVDVLPDLISLFKRDPIQAIRSASAKGLLTELLSALEGEGEIVPYMDGYLIKRPIRDIEYKNAVVSTGEVIYDRDEMLRRAKSKLAPRVFSLLDSYLYVKRVVGDNPILEEIKTRLSEALADILKRFFLYFLRS